MEDKILKQVNNAIGESIKKELTGYNKPLSNLVEKVIVEHNEELYKLINSEFEKILTAKSFRKAFKDALNEKLAKLLIARMEGALEKRVNQLRSDPVTGSKLTLAINNIVEEFL